MDKNSINQFVTKEKSNYPMIATGLAGIVITTLCLYIFFPNGFNQGLGISLLFTLLLFSFIGTFLNFYRSVSGPSQNTNYQKIFFILGGLIGLIIIPMGILTAINGVKEKEAHTETMINYGATTLMMVLSGLIYFFSKKTPNLSPNAKILYEQRNKYTFLSSFFVLAVISLYAINPQDIMTKYGGAVMFFSLFVAIVMFAMTIMYNYYFEKLSGSSLTDIPGWSFFLKSLYALFSVAISGGLIYLLVYQIGDEGPMKIIGNTLILVGMLSIIYKLINMSGYLEKSPFFQLIANIIFYIPCLLLSGSNTMQKSNPNDVGLLVVMLGLFALYFGLPKAKTMYNKWKLGGKQLIGSDGLLLNQLNNVAGYQKLNGDDNFNYTYGMSFWFYVESIPPNTNASYNTMTNIMSYGDKPSIKYDAEKNSLYFFMKQDDEQEPILVHKENDVMLQKWNNVIINYNGGTLDVFYNGNLVKSVNQIVPYMKYDMLTVGSENGVYGGIKNFIYYKDPVDSFTIENVYSMQK